MVRGSVGDSDPEPDPDPQYPHVIGPHGSGSISQRYGSGSESLPFSHNCLERTKYCLQNKIITQNFSK
jgi:hypothetical protein